MSRRISLARAVRAPLVAFLACSVGGTALVGATLIGTASSAAAATCPAAGSGSVAEAAASTDVDVVVQGHGWGHSMGMSQYGAQGAASLGCTYSQILTTYYSGAQVATPTLQHAVILDLMNGGNSATVYASSGTVTWTVSGTSTRVSQPKGETWTVAKASGGGATLSHGTSTKLSIGSGAELRAVELGVVATLTGSGGSALPALSTRYDYTRFVPSSAGLSMRQILEDNTLGKGIDKYLYGLAEVPVTWPSEAIKAQMVAARTYLVNRWSSTLGAYVIGTTTSTQVYTGYSRESDDATYGGHQKAAALATTGRVLQTSTGGAMDAMYTSSHGGYSEDYRYFYGVTTPVSYLRAVDDSAWDNASSNPYRSWSQGRTLASLAGSFGLDSVASIEVAPQGSSARLAGVTVHGTRAGLVATRNYDGNDARAILGVRSPGITFRLAPQSLIGDWDGDGKSDVGWYDNGAVSLNVAGHKVRFTLGRPGDRALAGDWNGDGKDTLAIFRTGTWYVCSTLTANTCSTTFGYGTASDLPVVGRWPGASRDSVGVVRGNQWLLRLSATGGAAESSFAWGQPTDLPTAGDWNGDGYDTPAVRRGATWYFANRLAPTQSDASAVFGSASDKLASGDWNGDAKDSLGVGRSATTFYQRDDLSAGPATRTVSFSR